jgi:conjugal transfer ATP-binding protein TraC
VDDGPGRSFEKLCKKAGGTYIEFRTDSKINLNPFSVVSMSAYSRRIRGGWHQRGHRHAEARLGQDVSMASALGRCRSRPSAPWRQAYKQYGRELTITGLRDAFITGASPSSA